ncbi:MAG: NFACT RNA binding domain-containing protein, partial [Nitrososphaeraceae archaeon]|nr:NFACT RNA binding domain-containing protein [Nitrososphaeraceae archaeon]
IEFRREKAWYERYHWFFTSDELLAIGGRDSSSNSAIIRKYMKENDLVFHADIQGSPFFLLKDAAISVKSNIEKSTFETAQSVVCFSRAWKEGYSVLDAYWIFPNQIGKQAPTGMSLPKGSFMIEGKKNYIRDIKLTLSVGITKIRESLVVFSGPTETVKNHSILYVTITNLNEEMNQTVKKIKSVLVSKAKDEMKEIIKTISLDEIIRAIPGGANIISCEFGKQSY